MKAFLALYLLSIGIAATAQTSPNSSLNTSINEDGKTMSIQVEGQRNGQAVSYNRTFDVTKLTVSEKAALKNRILDSLGIGEPSRPPQPSGGAVGQIPSPPPNPPTVGSTGQTVVTFQCETCTGKVKLMIASPMEDFSIERDAKANTDKRLFPYRLPLSPGDYDLKYYQNGVLQIQSKFTVKTGEEITVVVK